MPAGGSRRVGDTRVEGLPMASMPLPPDSGEDDQAPASSGVSHLSDAERLAAERLNGADAGQQAASDQPGPPISDPASPPDAPATVVESLAPPLPLAPIEPGSAQPPPIGSLTDAVAELTAAAEPPKEGHVGASGVARPDGQAPPIAAVAPATGAPAHDRGQSLTGAF